MRFFSIISFSCILFSLLSCRKHETDIDSNTEKEESKPLIEVSTESAGIFSQGISFENNTSIGALTCTLSFTAASSWSTEVNDTKYSSWITVQPSSGEAGQVSLTVSAQDNTSFSERTSVVYIKCGAFSKSFTVRQSGRNPNDVSFEELLAGPNIKITHHSDSFMTPAIADAKGKELIIYWEDGFNALYSMGITHTYSTEGEHTVVLQTEKSSGCTFYTLEGISSIDFSQF